MMEIVEEEYRTDRREVNTLERRDVEGPEQPNIELETGESLPARSPLSLEEVTEERVHQAILEAERLPRLPVQLIERYVRLAALRGETEQLEDGKWYAEIRGFPGVWAQGDSEQQVRRELAAVVRDWVLLKLQDKDRDLPEVDTINLNVL